MNAMRKCLLIAFVLLFCLIVSFKKVWGREWNPGIVGKLTILQGWEFALLLIRSVLFLSSSLKLKSNHERFAQVVHCHNKRVNICKSHRLLLTKEQFAHVAHNKRVKNSKNSYFCLFLDWFWTVLSTFLSQKVNHSLCSSLICSFLKSNHEQITQVALNKIETWVIRSGRS